MSMANERGANQGKPSGTPFEVIRASRAALRARAVRSMRGEDMLEALLAVLDEIERVHGWAAEMELGAEGHDNMDSARYWGSVREGLEAAAQSLADSCNVPPALRAEGGEF